MDGGGVGSSLGGNFVAHVGAGIRFRGGALRGQHGCKMAGLMKQIAGVAQLLRVNDQATGFQG